MYFNCPKLVATLLVEKCDGYAGKEKQKRRQVCCRTCNDWKQHTSITIPREVYEAPILAHIAANPIPTAIEMAEKRKVDALFIRARHENLNRRKRRVTAIDK